MTAKPDAYEPAIDRAVSHARAWLGSLADRPVGPRVTADELAGQFGGDLPAGPAGAAEVLDLLAAAAEPGLMAMPSGRFYGWVIGGTLPAALGADWMVTAWDQNAAMRFATPAMAAAEETAGSWVLDLLGLPAQADVGFVTGAMMANFTCLAAARHHVLASAGWEVERDGLTGAPRVNVFVGAERHDTVDLALRYLGLGAPTPVEADEQGRLNADALAQALAASTGPAIVCLQAGNVHSGGFDPFPEAIAVAHQYGAWVHVDGAFGLWAGASPRLRHLVTGVEAADSWATDAHKTLNVPYDCGISIVANRQALRSAMGVHASYLVQASDSEGAADQLDKVPEFSRRARGVPVWAALLSLGRDGVAGMVEGFVAHAQALAAGIGAIEGAEVLNDVVFTQVCVSFGSDERTKAITDNMLAGGTAWMSGSRWQGRGVLRVSVSNWSTDAADVALSVDAVISAASTDRS